MTLLPKAPRPLLRFDAFTAQRPNGTAVDSEGDSTGGRSTILNGRATLASVSAREQLVATQRNTTVDKALLLEPGLDVIEGDWVTVHGVLYEVVSAEDRRLDRRLLMRRIP